VKGFSSALRLLCRMSLHAAFMPLRRTSLRQRLTTIPVDGAPLSRAVVIHWDSHQVPFIEAETDSDLAVALGIVHAHLRLGQMELMRRLSQGRLSEIIGPLGLELDAFARTFDVGRATPDILGLMPEETRLWLESFARGINHYLARTAKLPPEFSILGIGREPWSSADIVTLGRLVAADVNWLVWIRLLKFRAEKGWGELWPRLLSHDIFSPEMTQNHGENGILQTLRSGSNSLAISAKKSATGASLIANDPHLGMMLPNPWLLVAMKSPSHHAVGCMLPGLPFIAFGRNPWIAWGGANLHAASSDIVAVPKQERIALRKEVIAVKGGPDHVIEIAESDWGPLIGHLTPFAGGADERLALRWVGHRPSDEITVMLRVGKASNWEEFREAFSGYAIPGLQFNVADISGRVGHVTGARVPKRKVWPPDDLTTAPGDGWDQLLGSADLPSSYDPIEGFVAAANARADQTRAIIGYFFSPPDRIRRLHKLMQSQERISLETLIALQRDVHLDRALAERDLLLEWAGKETQGQDGARLRSVLETWNGDYDSNSLGALAHELISYHLARRLVSERKHEAYDAAWGTRALIWQDFLAAEPQARSRAVREAFGDAAKNLRVHATWGSQHRLRLAHAFSRIPIAGRAYRFADLPAAGNSETLMKTAHGMTDRRHAAAYGSVARHISDLSDPDRNYFCLLGGQDGWLGSTTFADQLTLWQKSEYVALPLRPETARATFPHHTEFRPMTP
jgi:penicillin amidase